MRARVCKNMCVSRYVCVCVCVCVPVAVRRGDYNTWGADVLLQVIYSGLGALQGRRLVYT